jgi:hypothetical protein
MAKTREYYAVKLMAKPGWLVTAERNESTAYRQYRALGTARSKDVWEHCDAVLALARSRYRKLVSAICAGVVS